MRGLFLIALLALAACQPDPKPLTGKQVIEIETFCLKHRYDIDVQWDWPSGKTIGVACTAKDQDSNSK